MRDVPTILIIDSSLNACEFMTQVLERRGYRAISTTDGMQGLLLAFSEHPHCAVIDVFLAGKSGYELCRQLRSYDPHHQLQILLVSTKSTPLDQAYALRQGADRYLAKPFGEEIFLQTIESMLPERLRNAALRRRITQPQPVVKPSIPFPIDLLIPRWHENPDLLRSSNPLEGAVIIPDKQARRLFSAIDGRKSLKELGKALGLDQRELFSALRLLLTLQRIQVFTPDGKFVESTQVLDEL